MYFFKKKKKPRKNNQEKFIVEEILLKHKNLNHLKIEITKAYIIMTVSIHENQFR